MKLRALRVANFRRFAAPVAVEGIADGLNVLVGPNEMGKSTLFDALEAAFLTRFKVTGAVLDAMRPYAGGDPIVEVDFEAAGQRWRIRKQFGRGATAILTDIGAGRAVARNAEAEDLLSRLAARGAGRADDAAGRLGLVWIRQKRALLPPTPDTDPGSGLPKPRGEQAVLLDAIANEVGAAVSGDQFEGVRAKVTSALNVLLTPKRTGIKRNGPLDLARQARDEIRGRLDEAEAAASVAQNRLDRIATKAEELAVLQSPEARKQSAAHLAGLEQRLEAQKHVRTRRDLQRETAKAREAELAAASQVMQSRKSLLEALTLKRQALGEAAALADDIRRLSEELNREPVTPAALERLLTLDRARDVAAAELKGQAAVVTFKLAPSADGNVTIAGAPVPAGTRIDVPGEIAIDIKGVGTIVVASANADRGSDLEQRRIAAEAALKDALDTLGVVSIDAARERAASRAAKVDGLAKARARMAALAPDGVEKLRDEVNALDARLGRAAAAQPAVDAIETLAAAAVEARAAYETLSSGAMTDQAFDALASECAALREKESRRDAEIASLNMVLANLKGEQAGADEDGKAAQADALKGELERATKEVQRLEHEAQALRYLEATLAKIEEGARTEFVAPLVRRLQPYLAQIFGDAELGFTDGFAPERLQRGSVSEPVAALSDGTREQLSVLVRLGFAELLASGGEAVPLVLDDPFVYSDDRRLEALKTMLARLNAIPQTIILTCREEAFNSLPSHRLTLGAWSDAKTAS